MAVRISGTWVTVIVGFSLVIMLVQGLRHGGSLPAWETAWAGPPAGLFLAGAALLVIDMLSFGPFVSDYTRYLPERSARSEHTWPRCSRLWDRSARSGRYQGRGRW